LEINNYFILPDLQSSSDYAPLSVNISIIEKFVNEFKNTIGNINTSEILNRKSLEEAVQENISILDSL